MGFFEKFAIILENFWGTVKNIFMQFTFTDALDIFFVAVIIYIAIKFIRETRAAQLIKGIIILALLFFISSRLELVVMTSFLDYFFQFTWIALLIIFQPELRSALEKMGRSKVGRRLTLSGIVREKENHYQSQRRCIEAVSDAAMDFSNKKTGALIVFERTTKLREIIETGTVINAEPSVQLIGNIFFNKAPLHDGAMIVRDGIVYAAGCILPLTGRDNVNSELGTRHRAAIGMSENSDAVVLVVSEETGQISLAINGVLTRDYKKDTLQKALEDLMLDTSYSVADVEAEADESNSPEKEEDAQ